MPRFVALLRGVNVGKAKRIPMAELRALLSELGYSNIATLLNSGNAVFNASGRASAKHAEEIVASISRKLKLDVPVIVKSAKELAAIVAECPFATVAPNHSHFLIAFAKDNATLSDLANIESLVIPTEQFALGKHAAYLLCTNGILASKAAEALLGKAGKSVTTRNWATVFKLHMLASESDS